MAYVGEERWRHREFDLSDVRLHAVETGEGPLVLLLHGFPDFWWGWRWQLGELARSGFRVIAPDMRGYGKSEKPAGIWAYRLEALARDVADLVQAAGATRAAVVGHDWGGLVAWHAALRYPGLVERLAVLNAPTPAALRGTPFPPDQLLRSWYVYAFQLPGLPEAALSFADFALLRRTLPAEAVRADSFPPEALERLIEALSEPGALSAALDYYRALLWYGAIDSAKLATRYERPTLVLWGERDLHLAPTLAELDPARVPHGRVERIAEAGHWVQLDARERVTASLRDFLRAP